MKIRLDDHGSIWLAQPQDVEAQKWIDSTAPDDAQFFGAALVIEPRYVENFAVVFVNAGGDLA